jgi:hypothetical protein
MVLFAAVPDLLTAAGFLLVWLRADPAHAHWVMTGVITMLLEFFVVNASGFYAVVMYGEDTRGRRSLYLAGLAALYLLMLSAFAWGFHAWWMVGAFFWLTAGKLLVVWRSPAKADRSAQQNAAIVAWALSVAAYLGAVSASVMIDWPAGAVSPQVIAAAGFDGGGEWEKAPYRALAGGALYFAGMALLRTLVRLVLLRQRQSEAAAAV